MSVLHAIDVRLRQQANGSICYSGWTFKADTTSGLTLSDLIGVAGIFTANILPVINDLQHGDVENVSATYQARGTTTPSYYQPLSGGGQSAAAASTWMPPEFAFWFRWGVGETLKSIPGTVDNEHPIKRGGVFIPGCTDDYLDSGTYQVPAGVTADWAALVYYMTTPFTFNSIDYVGAVLGEQIVTGTGWRIAEIQDGAPLRITRLRSRVAVG